MPAVPSRRRSIASAISASSQAFSRSVRPLPGVRRRPARPFHCRVDSGHGAEYGAFQVIQLRVRNRLVIRGGTSGKARRHCHFGMLRVLSIEAVSPTASDGF